MTKKDRALKMIEKLMKTEYQMPSRFNITLDTYMLRAYQSWAIRELYKYTIESNNKDPLIIFDEWVCISDDMACFAKKDPDNFKWSVASDVGTQVLDEWLIVDEEDENDTNIV